MADVIGSKSKTVQPAIRRPAGRPISHMREWSPGPRTARPSKVKAATPSTAAVVPMASQIPKYAESHAPEAHRRQYAKPRHSAGVGLVP